MRTLIISPVLWRVLGGFAVGTLLTFGLSVGHEGALVPYGTTMELSS